MKNLITTFAIIALLATVASAANVDARISTREAYVGSPVILQLSISDATDIEAPSLPSIDGCDVRSAGSPSQSSQITIINGRLSESRSVTMQYLITPRREGTFTIPAMSFKVDGKMVSTRAQRFVATRSETGDLMFVEIEGGKESVFVGEPLDLKLKLWIKPFRDSRSGQTLSEGDMWNLISDSTSWGGFTEQVKTMAENRQRPRDQEVLRVDDNGRERSYYLYEIDATVYPKRAGEIDVSDVQIVVDYPTAISKSRSPFGSMFDDDMFGNSMFGGSSLMSKMMNDDMFGSPFGSRLAVTDSRPIVGEVNGGATKVLPVPMKGRPADYCGAVGKYQIVTQATPTTVDAGDPITLNIGIVGTGPMEVVQAPPLFEQSDLTAEFKVADESLAGFVQDDSKVFSTTIRPKRQGITEIPAIRFSFFDPEAKQFQTVTSDPIAITVNKADTLALDSVVSNAHNAKSGTEDSSNASKLPDFTNRSGSSVLMSQTPRGQSNWWWVFVAVPPIIFLATASAKHRLAIAARLPSFRSAKDKCFALIDRAKSQDDIAEAVIRFVVARTRSTAAKFVAHTDSLQTSKASRQTEAIGRLRTAGLYQVASEVESFFVKAGESDLPILGNTAKGLVQRVDTAIKDNFKNKVKTIAATRSEIKRARPVALLIAATLIGSASVTSAFAQERSPNATVNLTNQAAETLLAEATEAYKQGIAKLQTDAATAKELLATATKKYQLLVDSGIYNTNLYTNLGNAYLQTGELGQAIANYEKALRFDPNNTQATENLSLANAKVTSAQAVSNSATNSLTKIRSANNMLTEAIGVRSIIWVLALSSIAFWSLLTLRIAYRPFLIWKCVAVPMALLFVSLISVCLSETNVKPKWNAVIVVNNVSLHAGDSERFSPVITLDDSQGHRVKTLAKRGDWLRVRTADGHEGWVHAKDVEIVDA